MSFVDNTVVNTSPIMFQPEDIKKEAKMLWLKAFVATIFAGCSVGLQIYSAILPYAMSVNPMWLRVIFIVGLGYT